MLCCQEKFRIARARCNRRGFRRQDVRVGRDPVRLGDVLKAALARLPAGADIADHALWGHWDDVVGPTLARHARPRRLRRGVLVVAVDDSLWMHELQFLKQELCARLNERMGRAVVRQMFLALGD
jgi:predicted nucleic acid-binding Zn ribbon protein